MTLDKTPVKNCEQLEFGSDSYWECAVKYNTNPENHQAGSCKMGPDTDPLAVVDNELRVKGVQGVRVADTSIMPNVISGNTHAPAVMIGERAADFIKKCYKNQCKQYDNDFYHHYYFQHHNFQYYPHNSQNHPNNFQHYPY